MALIEKKGCTLFPDHGIGPCCERHDRAYARANLSRSEADRDLLLCGVQSGHPWRAIVAFIGVRMFGWVRWYQLRHKQRNQGKSNA